MCRGTTDSFSSTIKGSRILPMVPSAHFQERLKHKKEKCIKKKTKQLNYAKIHVIVITVVHANPYSNHSFPNT